MSSERRSDAVRQGIPLALIAVGLLAAPLTVSVLHVGEPTYRYERLEVTTNGTNVKYATERDVPFETPISEEIACAGSWEVRACAFERLLLDDRTVTTETYSSNLDRTRLPVEERYRYVRINDTVYEVGYVTNASARREGGMYRVELALERTAPDRALRSVSLPVTSDDLSQTVAAAARTGEASASREIDVPETPIRLEDGTYYRVYQTERVEPSPGARGARLLLTYIAPLFGLPVAVDFLQRIDVTYVGRERRR